MVHIEKLSLKNVVRYSWQTFVDNFLGNTSTRQHKLELYVPGKSRSYLNTDILTSEVLYKLKGVSLGKFYGMKGIDIDYLLSGAINIDNLLVEVTIDHLSYLPAHKLKSLFENYSVILNDFEEGGNLYGLAGLDLVSFLTERNIQPKQLFFVGGCFKQKDYPQLNIHKIQYDYWMIVSATINNFFSDALMDSAYKQTLLDRLDQPAKNFCLIPIFKPRIHRLELLAYLDSLNMLDICDWSLAFNFNARINSYKSLTTKTESLPEHIKTFLTNGKYSFPKFVPNNTGVEWQDIIATNSLNFNKYKFFVSVETYIGNEITTVLGDCGFASEKTFKCFLTGSAPILYGPSGIADHIRSLGFKTLDDIDTTDYKTVGNYIQQKSINQTYEKTLIQHNFDLITNKSFLTDQIVNPLNKIADLINSIRR